MNLVGFILRQGISGQAVYLIPAEKEFSSMEFLLYICNFCG
jgi:hypothetical protein